MKPIKNEDAKAKWCPFGVGYVESNGGYKCAAEGCMAWRQVYSGERREDHSGADTFMLQLASKTGRILRREGPRGSYGFLILDAVGCCARLVPAPTQEGGE